MFPWTNLDREYHSGFGGHQLAISEPALRPVVRSWTSLGFYVAAYT